MNLRINVIFIFTILLLPLILTHINISQVVAVDTINPVEYPKYFEYPTQTWIVNSTTYLDQFIEWNFELIGGRTKENLIKNPYLDWIVTWVQKPFLEIFDEKTNDTLRVVNPYITYSTSKNLDFIYVEMSKEKTSTLKLVDLKGFEVVSIKKVKADILASYNYSIQVLTTTSKAKPKVILDSKIFVVAPPKTIDILDAKNGSFTFSLKSWNHGIGLEIGFGSTYVYSSATNTITVTGGTSGSPITFNDLWTQDKAGTLTLESRTGVSTTDESPVALDYNLRPTDYYVEGGSANDFYITVSAWSGLTDATIMLIGTNTAGTSQNENFTVTGNGASYATKY